MNKKILIAAIGAAMVAGPLAAQADVKISGRVAGELVNGGNATFMQDNGNTRLQFDMKDGSGWYARMAIDGRLGKIGSSDGSNLKAYRDQYVGYKADFGSIQLGRMAGAVKNLEKDPFIGTFLELRNNAVAGGSYGSSSFLNSMIQYANKMGDVSFKFQYDATDMGKTGDMGLGVKAKLAGAKVYLGYNNVGDSGATFTKFGGSMKFGDITGRVHYETLSPGGSQFVLGGSMGLGGGSMVDVSYGDRGGGDAYTRIAYMKKASKKARWWVGYVNNGNKTADATFGGGARVDF